MKGGVIEPLEGKAKMIKFATEAAITLLRIDDLIRLEKRKEENPDPRKRMEEEEEEED